MFQYLNSPKIKATAIWLGLIDFFNLKHIFFYDILGSNGYFTSYRLSKTKSSYT